MNRKTRKTRKPRPMWSKSKKRWIARITIAGRRREKRCRTKDEAYRQIEEWWEDRQAGVDAGNHTLGSFVLQWVQRREPLKDSSRDRYMQQLRHLGTAAEIPLEFLRRKHVVELLRNISRTATRKAIQSMLKTILNDAVEAELIRINPVQAIKRAKHKKRSVDIFSEEEVAAIRAALQGHHYEAAVELSLEVGLRPGELWALQWSDLTKSTLRIVRTVSVIESNLVVTDSPKTDAGRREIPLSDRLIECLTERRKAALVAGLAGKSNLMFPSPRGGMTWPSNFRSQFKRLLVAAGVKNRHLYTCRHTAASTMLNGGVPVPIVAAILGHRSGEVTLRVYSHLIGVETERAREFWNSHNRRYI